jgi:hypothetical protein
MTLIAALTLAVIIEVLIEALKPLLAPLATPLDPHIALYLYIAAAIGLAMSFMFQVDLVASLLEAATGAHYAPTVLGIVLTGLFIGRGSNVIHDLIRRFAPSPTPIS